MHVSNTKDKHLKEPKCTYCEGAHYQTFCPRKPKKGFKQSTKPLKRTAIKQPSYEERLASARKAAQRSLERQKVKSTTKPKKPLKRAKLKAQSQSYRSTQIKKADRIFSKYIRLRFAINFFARCVTCGRRDLYKNMQNGHYISRRIMATRYDEQNCNVQCSYCNETLSGNLVKYKAYLERTYGAGVIIYLQQKAQKGGKIPTHELQAIIDKYEHEVEILLKKSLHKQ